MTFHTTTTRFMDFVQMVVVGPATISGFVELVHRVEDESKTWADRRVLVDLRGVEGRLDAAEQVFLGEMVAQHLPHLERVASVVPEDQITRNSENAAQTMGMQLRVFSSREEATDWLKAPLPHLGAAQASTSRPAPLQSDA
jgi:hypothetical protein